MDTTNYVKGLIARIDPKRSNDQIAGQHPDLEFYKKWYKGYNEWHIQKQLVQGEVKNKTIAFSGLGRIGASEWAGMFLNEKTKISVPDEKGDQILQEILNYNKITQKLNSFGEKYFGLGYGTTCVMPHKINFIESDDKSSKTLIKSENNRIKIYFLDATRSYPITIEDEEVTECAIVRFSTNKVIIQTHLLDDQGNYVVGEVSGRSVEGSVTIDYNTMKVWNTNSPTKLFQAWYPMKVDNEHIDNQIGTSVNSTDAVQWIKAFDITFDKFITEFKNGGKRRYVSSKITYIDEHGQEVPIPLGDEDVYLPPNEMENAHNLVQEHSSDLRSEAFIRGLQFFANMYGRSIGLGEDAISVDSAGRPMQTATQVILKKNGGFRNVQRNENLAEENLKDLCMAIKEVYNSSVSDGLKYDREDIVVKFDDNIVEDTTAKKQQDISEVNAGVMTAWEFRGKYYEESEDDAKAFLQENGLLIDKYMNALQVGAITPAQFVDLVYGEKVKDRDEIIAYITEKLSAPTEEDLYADEETDPFNNNQNPDQEEDEEDDE